MYGCIIFIKLYLTKLKSKSQQKCNFDLLSFLFSRNIYTVSDFFNCIGASVCIDTACILRFIFWELGGPTPFPLLCHSHIIPTKNIQVSMCFGVMCSWVPKVFADVA